MAPPEDDPFNPDFSDQPFQKEPEVAAADEEQIRIWQQEAARDNVKDEFLTQLNEPLPSELAKKKFERKAPKAPEEPPKFERKMPEEPQKKEMNINKTDEESVETLKEKIQHYLGQMTRFKTEIDDYKKSQEQKAAEEERIRLAEEARREEETRKIEEARKAEETRRAEEARKVEEARKIEQAALIEEIKKAEAVRLAEEVKLAEEARKLEEENKKSSIPKGENPEALKAKVADYHNQIVRLEADFANFRKRSEKEKIEAIRFGREVILEQLISLNDIMQNALIHAQSAKDVAPLKKGFEMVVMEFERLLKAEGAEEIKTLGQPFNPHIHEAIERVETDDEDDNNKVIEEVQKGYMLDGRLLRTAKVKVAHFKE